MVFESEVDKFRGGRRMGLDEDVVVSTVEMEN